MTQKGDQNVVLEKSCETVTNRDWWISSRMTAKDLNAEQKHQKNKKEQSRSSFTVTRKDDRRKTTKTAHKMQ